MDPTNKVRAPIILSKIFASDLQRDLFRRLSVLADQLDLSLQCGNIGSYEYELILSKYHQNPEQFFAETITMCEQAFPEVLAVWQEIPVDSHWCTRRHGIAFDVLVANLQTIATSHPLAMIEFMLIGLSSRSFAERIALGIDWLIRRGPEQLITRHDVMNILGKTHSAEYIACLPADQLHEYLLSDRESDRIKARNKFKAEQIE